MSNDTEQPENYPTPSLTPWHWGWAAALAAIVLITAAIRYAMPIRDGDIWFHMLYGKYFLDHHTLIADHTIFSWTPSDNDTIYCTWLPDIFFYLLHKATGLAGLFAFRYTSLAMLVLGCFLLARRLRVATHPLTWFFCLIAVLMSYTGIWEKPETFSFICMTLTAWNWWHIRTQGERAWINCYLFPLIMLVWVNSHGGFVFGCVFLLLIWLGEMMNTWLSRPGNTLSPRLRKHLTIALALAAGAVFLTPYGFNYPWQLLHSLQPTEENLAPTRKISSYISPVAGTDPLSLELMFCADLAIFSIALLALRNLKKMEWSTLLTNLVFALLYTRFFRTTYYWAPVFLLSVLPLLALSPVIPPGRKQTLPPHRWLPMLALAGGLCLSGLSIHQAYLRPSLYQWVGFGENDVFNPVEEAAYIKKYFPHARIGNTYNEGAYLLWVLWPANKVFIDARHFPYFKWAEDFWALYGGKDVAGFVQQYPADLWCVGMQNPKLSSWFLASPDWQLAFCGKSAAVFVKKGVALPSGVPIFSSSIATSKNLGNSLTLLQFLANARELTVAETVADGMRHNVSSTFRKEVASRAGIFIAALKAYYTSDFEHAATLFESLPQNETMVLRNNYVYGTTLLHLSARAWAEKDSTRAKELNTKAWRINPSLAAAYNAGVMAWYDAQQSPLAQDSITTSTKNASMAATAQDNWKTMLLDFIKSAPRTPAYTPYIQDAQAMLLGVFDRRPDLMLPP